MTANTLRLAPDHLHAALDKAGATASIACAIHCMALPLALTALPLVGLRFLADERLEWALFGTSAFFGITSLFWGFRRHRRRDALAILFLGLAVIGAGRWADSASGSVSHAAPYLLLVGGLTVAFSHFRNLRFCRNCCPRPQTQTTSAPNYSSS